MEEPSPDFKIHGMGKYGLQLGGREGFTSPEGGGPGVQWSVYSVYSVYSVQCTVWSVLGGATGVPSRVSVNERSVQQSDLAPHSSSVLPRAVPVKM